MTPRQFLKTIKEEDMDKNIEICDYYTDDRYHLCLVNDLVATSNSTVLLFAGIHIEREKKN